MYCDPSAVKIAVRQIERWIYAAKQDRHPAISLLHANYAVGDLDMLRQMVSDGLVERAAGKSPLALMREAMVLQDRAQKALVVRYGITV